MTLCALNDSKFPQWPSAQVITDLLQVNTEFMSVNLRTNNTTLYFQTARSAYTKVQISMQVIQLSVVCYLYTDRRD